MIFLDSLKPEITFSTNQIIELVLRIAMAAFLGAMIGLERTLKKKDVGVRTHCLIASAMATLMVLGKYAFGDTSVSAGFRGADTSRIAAQAISGVSFLCAAVIFKSNNGIKGLSTAGGMWATAVIGLATGAGMYLVASGLCVVILFIQFLLPIIHFSKKDKHIYRLTVELADDGVAYDKFNNFLDSYGGTRDEANKLRRENGILYFDVNVHSPNKISDSDINKFTLENKNIYFISIK